MHEEHREVWQRVAKGITEAVAGAEDYDRTLMAYHIAGGNSSSAWFHGAAWLDVNMIQTWSAYDKISSMVTADYGLTPPKPVVLAEAAYEDGPQYPTRPINAHVIRKQAYWSYFAGGFHTYGNTNVWNFGTYKPEAIQDWRSALDSLGAASLSVLRQFFEDVEWWNLVPDQSILVDESGDGGTLNVALRSGDVVIAYLPNPATVVLAMDRIRAAGEIRATWVDPRSGERSAIDACPGAGARSFSTPEGWEDALLVLVADQGVPYDGRGLTSRIAGARMGRIGQPVNQFFTGLQRRWKRRRRNPPSWKGSRLGCSTTWTTSVSSCGTSIRRCRTTSAPSA
ncbi:MAG: DUF4038 domain-containing protein [Thermomicrobiales bacterium]